MGSTVAMILEVRVRFECTIALRTIRLALLLDLSLVSMRAGLEMIVEGL